MLHNGVEHAIISFVPFKKVVLHVIKVKVLSLWKRNIVNNENLEKERKQNEVRKGFKLVELKKHNASDSLSNDWKLLSSSLHALKCHLKNIHSKCIKNVHIRGQIFISFVMN